MTTLQHLRNEQRTINEKIAALETDIFKKRYTASLGKCYKVNISYSLPDEPTDYWWFYCKITSVEENRFRAWSFQRDCDDKIEIEFDVDFLSIKTATEISPEEFQAAWNSLIEEIKIKAATIESSY